MVTKRVIISYMVSILLIISSTSVVAASSTRTYSASSKEICLNGDFVSCTININARLDLTYSDSGSMRSFTDHRWSTIFTSINATEVTSSFSYSMGNLIHRYSTGGSTVCYNNGPSIPVYSDPDYLSHLVFHSITKVSHALRSNGSAEFAYMITGDAFITKSRTFSFSGIAK